MNLYYKIKRYIACRIINKKIPINLSQALITFSFDDVPNSAITNGARILKQFGYNGTYYISLGLRDKTNTRQPYFDHSQLQQIVDDGGELACHTFDHIQLYKSDKNKIVSDLEKNQLQMEALIPGYKFHNFSYPYGQQTFLSKLIVKKRYRSARGVNAGMHIKHADINNLKAVELQGSLELKKAFSLIDEAIQNNAWLILYTHDVEANPTICGCSPDYFEAVVKYCFDKKVKVVTIDEGINIITSA